MELRIGQTSELHDPVVSTLEKISMTPFMGWVGQSGHHDGKETNLGPCEI
jgi:hypothetical protein